LKTGCNEWQNEAALEQWKKLQLDRLIIDYLLRAGHFETASDLASCTNIEYLTNIPLFLQCKKIEASLRDEHDTSQCLEWCHENKSKLRRMKSDFEMKIRQQDFVEMIRIGRRIDAIKYAQKYFSEYDGKQWQALLPVMGMLAFEASTPIPPYKHLFSDSRWAELAENFRKESFRLYHLNAQSMFSACLSSGLAALKTPQCYDAESKKTILKNVASLRSRTHQCPVCIAEVGEMAKRLPHAHAGHSRLICAYSGEPLNEHNPPLMLPNGMIYGQNSLLQLASQSNGMIVCPRTGDSFALSAAEKVYIM